MVFTRSKHTITCLDVVDSIAAASDAITKEETFDTLKGLLK